MKLFDPMAEIKKFEHIKPERWREQLQQYTHDDLCAIIGILLIGRFYTTQTMNELSAFLTSDRLPVGSDQ